MTMKHVKNCPDKVCRNLFARFSLAIATCLSLASASKAFEPEAFDQLLQTGNCPRCDLSGADLRRLNLSGANLEQANLTKANFYESTLDNADLSGADLTGAYLAGVSAIAANFNSAKLDQSIIYNSDSSGASMYGTLFGSAYIEDSQFINTLLVAADLSEAFLVSSNFEGAILCGAEMVYGDYRYGCLDEESENESTQ
jgi:uncharacterized protein YjbI with pentapeptide repeats